MYLCAIDFPLINASLNSIATVLLVIGYLLIRLGRERAHKWTMFAAFAVSTVFLVSYLAYHYTAGHVEFAGPPPASYFYYAMLVSHILLAMAVPVLAMVTIYFAVRDQRTRHRKLARWTLPIWLYVSVTGVLIYVMLYQLYPPSASPS